ncbi:MAG: hypothetical protein OXU42_00860 [Deltaproteobacteria bacterium]|nr:hypothetical protein [Deltaproteobacteria bacterium]
MKNLLIVALLPVLVLAGSALAQNDDDWRDRVFPHARPINAATTLKLFEYVMLGYQLYEDACAMCKGDRVKDLAVVGYASIDNCSKDLEKLNSQEMRAKLRIPRTVKILCLKGPALVGIADQGASTP